MPAETTETKPVRNGVLYMRLADEILAYIRDNHIQSGERIPSERRLAELFSTSRTSVREAVRVLQNKYSGGPDRQRYVREIRADGRDDSYSAVEN